MIRSPLSVTSVLDEASEVVSITSPWVGLLVVTGLPYKFLQALFLDQLIEVGGSAAHYGNLLGGTANMIVAALLLSLWGRAVYARACRLAMGRELPPGRETWRVPAAALVSYLLTSSVIIIFSYASLFTCIGVIVAAMFAGLAIGTIELNDRVSLVEPFRLMFRSSRTVMLVAFVFVFYCAVLVALVNVAAAFGIGIWAAGAIGGWDAPRQLVLFGPGNRRYLFMLIAGAMAAVEPFWIATHVVFVRKAGAEERGDDLRLWFEELRRTP